MIIRFAPLLVQADCSAALQAFLEFVHHILLLIWVRFLIKISRIVEYRPKLGLTSPLLAGLVRVGAQVPLRHTRVIRLVSAGTWRLVLWNGLHLLSPEFFETELVVLESDLRTLHHLLLLFELSPVLCLHLPHLCLKLLLLLLYRILVLASP